ncbi:MAG: hypothetical protein ACERJ1_07980 [Halodesulfovibrio sp.]|uniref:hypothetical protein n=1 Tax=Halodesulfovibrio sp. TaxID=1912772 RepID=UPI00359D9BF8
MKRKEYILSKKWCPASETLEILLASYTENYGTPEFKYVIHPPKLKKFEEQAVLYGKIKPNFHLFLSMDNVTEHLPFQSLQQKINLEHIEVTKESLDIFAIAPLEIVKNIEAHSTSREP